MPFKEFVAGTPALASDINTYLMEQSVMTFTNSAARDAALPTPNEGMVVYLTASDHFQVYGSAWVTFDIGWNAWTPTLTNLTQGTGATLSAFYARIGKTVVAQCYATMGGAGLVVGGQFSISLPVDIASSNRSLAIGTVQMRDAGGSVTYLGSVYALSSAPSLLRFNTIGVGGTYATQSSQSAATPFTWNGNANNYFSFSVMYQGV